MDESIVATIILTARNLASGTIAQVGTELTAMGSKGASSGERLAAGMSKAAVGVGALTAGVAAFSVHEAVQFQDAILKVANNTGMSTHEMEQMRSSVLKLGAEGPAPLSEIAQGFEKAANAGFHGAAGFTIVHAAMQAAVETGAKVPAVVDSVTGALKNFRLPASDAGKVLGEMMRAAAEGDVRLPDLTDNLNKVSVMAGALHLPLNEVLAAFSTLTTYTHNAALSQTVLYGALSHIIAPTKASTTEIEALSKASGIDLVGAYAAVRDHTMDLTGFFGVLREALHKANLTTGQQTAAMYALGGGLRGGLALVSLLSQGWEDYNKRARDVANSTNLVGEQWKRTQETLDFQLGLLRNHVDELAITVGTTLVPALVGVSKDLIPAAQNLQAFAQAHPGVVKGATEAGIAVGLLGLAVRAGDFALKPFGGSASAAAADLVKIALASDPVTAGLLATTIALPLVGNALAGTTRHMYTLSKANTDTAASIVAVNDEFRTGVTIAKEGGAAWSTAGVSHQTFLHALQQGQVIMPQYNEAVKQVLGGLRDLNDGQKNTFIAGIEQADHSAQMGAASISAHYNALKSAVVQDLMTQTNESKRLWDEQRIAGLDASEKQELGAINYARLQAEGVVKHNAMMSDGVIKENLRMRSDVIKSATQLETDIMTKAAEGAAGVIQESMKQHHGVVTQAAQQKADEILHAGEAASKKVDIKKNETLGTLAEARKQREGVLKELEKTATDGVHSVERMKDHMISDMRDLGQKSLAPIQGMHQKVSSEFAGMSGTMHSKATEGAQNTIKAFQIMEDRVSGHSIVPDMHRAVVREFQAMGTEATAETAKMASGVEAQMSALAAAAEGYGAAVGANFAAGLGSEAGAVAAAAAADMAAAKASLEFKSPNKKGDDPFKWGKSVGQNFAAGLSSEGAAVAAAADSILAQIRGKLGNVSIGPGGVGLGAEFAQLTAEMKRLPPDFQAAGHAIVAEYTTKVDDLEKKYNRDRQAAITDFLQKEKIELELHPKQFGAWVTQHTQALKDHLEKLKSGLNEHVANLKKVIDSMKSPGGLWDALKKQIDSVANNDLKALSLAILEGKGNIHGLAVEAANAQENAKRMADSEEKAAIKIDLASGNVADAFDRLAKISTDELSKAEKQFAYDLINHTGNLTRDAAAIERHAGAVDRDSAALQHAADITKFVTDAIKAFGDASYSAGRALGLIHVAAPAAPPLAPGAATSALQSVTNASLNLITQQDGVIAANSAISVQEGKATVDAINGQIGIINAQTNVIKTGAASAAKIAADNKAIAADRKADDKAQLAADKATQTQNSAAATAAAKVAADNKAILADIKAGDKAKLAIDQAKLVQDTSNAAAAAKIATDSNAIQSDTLKANDAQLAIDQAQLAQDQQDAYYANLIANEQLKLAQDTAYISKIEDLAAAKVAQDQLQKATDEVTLATDQLNLASDQVALLGAINTDLGGLTPAAKKIADDQAKIITDNAIIVGDQTKLAIDTASEEAIKTGGDIVIALDNLAIANTQQAQAMSDSGVGYTVTVNPDGSVVTQLTSSPISPGPTTSPSSDTAPILSTGSGTDQQIAEKITAVASSTNTIAQNTTTITKQQQTQIDQHAAELAALQSQLDWLTFNNDTLKELLGLAQAGVKGDVSSTQGLKKYKQRVQAHRAFHR